MMVDSRIRPCLVLFLLVAVGLVAPALLAHAEGGEPGAAEAGFAISWWTVDGGGTTRSSTGGTFELVGTIAQPDAGMQEHSPYVLTGGFWPGPVGDKPYQIYLPLVVRGAGP
jgi:hypothetical protein